MDSQTTLQDMKEALIVFRDERQWEKFHTPQYLAEAINIEAGELLECFLWKNPKEIQQALKIPSFKKHVCDEMSDVLAFTLSLANTLNIDVSKAFFQKLKQNEKKYPVKKVKGSAKKYTEY
jgi:NTP pyrophosphatase (non-canonical NTP hydrolase)